MIERACFKILNKIHNIRYGKTIFDTHKPPITKSLPPRLLNAVLLATRAGWIFKGYDVVGIQPALKFRRGRVIMEVYPDPDEKLERYTVVTEMTHKKRRTSLKRKNINIYLLSLIVENPRIHVGNTLKRKKK